MSTEASGPSRRARVPTIREISNLYLESLQALRAAQPERSRAESTHDLKEIHSQIRELSSQYNKNAKNLYDKFVKAGSGAEAELLKQERKEQNKLTSEYISVINEDLQMEDEDALSGITNTTSKSQTSEDLRVARRGTIYLELQKAKAAEKYEQANDMLEQQEAAIRMEKKSLERKKTCVLLETELSVLSQTEEELEALEDEIQDLPNSTPLVGLDDNLSRPVSPGAPSLASCLRAEAQPEVLAKTSPNYEFFKQRLISQDNSAMNTKQTSEHGDPVPLFHSKTPLPEFGQADHAGRW